MNVHIASVQEETKPFKCHIFNACFVNLNLHIGLVNEIRKLLKWHQYMKAEKFQIQTL